MTTAPPGQKISDLLAAGPTLSFEFFPPKTDEAERQLEKAIHELAALDPSFVSVTYGAGGSTRDRTRDIVVQVNDTQPFPAMPHLTCVGPHPRPDHRAARRVRRRRHRQHPGPGRRPARPTAASPAATSPTPPSWSSWSATTPATSRSASPPTPSCTHARRATARPTAATSPPSWRLADFAITQFFFEADDYLRMVDELAVLGSSTPVLPGIMPPGATSLSGLMRMAGMNGSVVPVPLLERLEAAGDDVEARRAIGVEVATDLSQRLLDAGAPGLHLYALNRSEVARRIVDELGLRSRG